MTKPIPPAILTLYADLAQQVETAAPAGTPYRRARAGIEYIYAKVPAAGARADLFLGRSVDPAAQSRAADLAAGAAMARTRRDIVRSLRGHGFAAPHAQLGRILSSLAASRLFDSGAIAVGTAAYQLMEAAVEHFLPSPTLMTGDFDLAAASPALKAEPAEPFLEILRRADPSFSDLPQLDHTALPSRFRAANGFLVDLLTPLRSRRDRDPVAMPGLQAGAFPAQQLEWLLKGSRKAVALWGSGVAVAIPAPARFAVHKLILAQRREGGGALKRSKDLAQAGALIAALKASDPFSLEDALADAAAQGRRGWREPIARSLAELGNPVASG